MKQPHIIGFPAAPSSFYSPPPLRKIPGPQAQIPDLPLGCLCEQWEELNAGVSRIRTLAGEEDPMREQEESRANKFAFNRKL